MAGWYIKTDLENKITEVKARGRGRPPRDFISWDGEGEPVIGEEVNPDDLIKKDAPKPEKVKSKKASSGEKHYDVKLTETGEYERNEDGLVYKVVKRGRCAQGSRRVNNEEFMKLLGQGVDNSTKIKITGGDNAKEVMPTIKMDDEPEKAPPVAPVAPVAAGTIPGATSKTRVFKARKTATLSAVQGTIRFNNNPDKQDGIVSMVAPECIGRTEDLVEGLHLGWVGAQIDIHTGTGNVHIWSHHSHGDPDIIIEGAIIEGTIIEE